MAKTIRLGDALREARVAAGLSARDLERISGVSTAQISKVESGARLDPSFRTVVRLAQGIGLSLDDLVARLEGRISTYAVDRGRAEALAALRKAKVENDNIGASLDTAFRALGLPSK